MVSLEVQGPGFSKVPGWKGLGCSFHMLSHPRSGMRLGWGAECHVVDEAGL